MDASSPETSLRNSFDFIVVGGGTAGSLLASRLSSTSNHRVLLIEAGGKNDDINHQISGERYLNLTAPDYLWPDQTVPQPQLDGRILQCGMGKGLGGSSAVNFCVFTRGASADYDRWASLVDDDVWSWKHVQPRFQDLESYHHPGIEFQKYAKPLSAHHGYKGPIDVGSPGSWEKGFKEFLDAAQESGLPVSLDNNSGNPIGMCFSASSAYKGRRVTSARAFLSDTASNLTIMTDTTVNRVLFQGKRAIGVETTNGNFYSSKEVILSAGAYRSPKLLLLSGIGPAKELTKHDIAIKHDLPGVGKNLHDHAFSIITIAQKPGTNDRPSFYSDPEAMKLAREQWMTDQTGPLSIYMSTLAVGYLKLDQMTQFDEYETLEPAVREYLSNETVPTWELVSHTPAFTPDILPTDAYLGLCVGFMNGQSTGSLELRSADPADSLLIDSQLLSHPFDRRVAIESMKETLAFLDKPAMAKDTLRLINVPEGRSDDEIWAYIKQTTTSMWHPGSTVKMGRPDDAGTCVDKDFCVVGVEGLRVVDMSIAPLIPNAHTQAVAYLIGDMAAEKICAQYTPVQKQDS